MVFRTYCATCVGLDVVHVVVEVSVQQGVGLFLVGLPDVAVKESLLRVSTAIEGFNYRLPGWKVVINLAPANIKKVGSLYDVAIAIGVLAASHQINVHRAEEFLILGELALDGTLREIPGALPIAMKGYELGYKKAIFPLNSAAEAAEVDGLTVYGAKDLSEVVAILSGLPSVDGLEVKRGNKVRMSQGSINDFGDVVGQEFAKRGLEIAASGGHNILLNGSPGSGKSFMASCLPSILPPMSREESLVTSAVYSVAGLLSGGLIEDRPFRTPHNTSSVVSMLGGGPNAAPGEISLAHNGVLYLDELSLFSSQLLDLLRQPIEDRYISISRAKYKVRYPSSFMLVGSMNPCPCGYYGFKDKCNCTPGMITRYNAKISGPLLDRIDLNIRVAPVEKGKLVAGERGECSADIARRVIRTRKIQLERFKNEGIYTNSQMNAKMLNSYCPLGNEQKQFMERVMERFDISARGYGRVLKLARTIADMEQVEKIEISHISEALQYRF